MKHCSIKTWDEEERPREKLMHKGPAALTNAELLAILLHSGNREKSAVDLARELLASCEGRLSLLAGRNIHQLRTLGGMGTAKAATVQAAFELARRLDAEIPADEFTIRRADTVARMMTPLIGSLPHEECWVLYLNRAGKYVGREQVSAGGQTSTVIDIKIIVKKAVERLASGIILVHNHPSGNPLPGEQDRTQTGALRQALAVFDIALIDHVVIGKKKYFSFSEENY
jgi:DNA repair protein radc